MNVHIMDLTGRYPALKECIDEIERAFTIMSDCYSSGCKVLICGNGGSAADAEHWAGELMKGFHKKRPLSAKKRQNKNLDTELAKNLQGALPTIPLTGFLSLTTAFANDMNSDYIFAQMVWALGKANDVLIGISTSGNSTNILYAVQTAKARGMRTIGLTGKKGGSLADIVDVRIRVPAEEVHQVQEYHLPVYHCLCMMLEEKFFPE